MQRIYTQIVKRHLQNYNQMVFLAGPRQVGKTTISQMAQALTDHFIYLNWDVRDHRLAILEGAIALAERYNLLQVYEKKPIVVFDELHKYREWKNFLKGFFDLYKDKVCIIVTGSSKLNIFRRGGDSLMGRYFCYRIHPVSVAEYAHVMGMQAGELPVGVSVPQVVKSKIFEQLLEFGGGRSVFKTCPRFLGSMAVIKI